MKPTRILRSLVAALAATACAGTAAAAVHIADIDAGYGGEDIGLGGFMFDPEEVTVVPADLNGPAPGEDRLTVSGLIGDFAFVIRLGGDTLSLVPDWKAAWWGDDPDMPRVMSLRSGTADDPQTDRLTPGLTIIDGNAPDIGTLVTLFFASDPSGTLTVTAEGPIVTSGGTYRAEDLSLALDVNRFSSIPLPGAAALFLTGLGGFAGIRRLRRASPLGNVRPCPAAQG